MVLSGRRAGRTPSRTSDPESRAASSMFWRLLSTDRRDGRSQTGG